LHGAIRGFRFDATPKEFVSHHAPPARGYTLAILHPRISKLLIVEQAGRPQALDFVVDCGRIDTAHREAGAHFRFAAWPAGEQAERSVVRVHAAFGALQLFEKFRGGFLALGDVRACARFVTEQELAAIGEHEQPLASAR
jgi:hypothetical protein